MFAHNAQFLADHATTITALGGLLIGLVFGAVVIATNFCTMGAISDIVTAGDYRRFRAWVLASAIALAGAQALNAAGLVELDQSIYLQGRLNWLGSLAGGLVFGFGMALAGGCPGRNVARAGSGDLRAMVTLLVTGIFAFVTMTGLLAPARRFIENATAIPLPEGATASLADLAALLLGVGNGAVRPVMAGLLAAAAFSYCLGDAGFRRSPRPLLAGLAIGVCAIAGWLLTTLAQDTFASIPTPPSSLSFIRPVAQSIDYLTRFMGMIAMSFGVALVIGTLAGALLTSLASGSFRLQGFADPADTLRNLAGAVLMGIGGVLALGCSIGQGVTGLSTMAAGSFIAFAAMIAGTRLGLSYLERKL